MNLINISGNTFYIRGGTNTGLYLFDDNSALIIDPGLSGARPNKIIKILKNSLSKFLMLLLYQKKTSVFNNKIIYKYIVLIPKVREWLKIDFIKSLP